LAIGQLAIAKSGEWRLTIGGLGSPALAIGPVTAPDRSSFVIPKVNHSSMPQSPIEWRNLQSLLVNKSSILNPQ